MTNAGQTGRFEGQTLRQIRRLRFAGALEREYRAVHLARTRVRTEWWNSIECLAPPVIAFLYHRVHEGGPGRPLIVAAILTMFVCSLVLLALAVRREFQPRYLAAAIWLVPARSMAFAIVVADFVAAGTAGTAALVAGIFGQFFFSSLLFHHAALAALATLSTFTAAMLAFGVPAGVFSYAIATVGAVLTMAAVVSYDVQIAARVAFLEHGVARSRAEHDGLTGLRNRRDFDERLDAYWNQGMAQREALTLLMLDVDHFKAYNDRYGHQAGDEVLRRVAVALRLAGRGSDVVARYGGEEFVMLALGLDEPGAAALGERVRSAVEQLAIANERSSCAQVVTVSIGVAHVVPQAGRTAQGAVQLADQNLYVAKRLGRNRCVLRSGDYASLTTGRFDVAT